MKYVLLGVAFILFGICLVLLETGQILDMDSGQLGFIFAILGLAVSIAGVFIPDSFNNKKK